MVKASQDTVRLESLGLRALAREYDSLNWSLFQSKLTPPVMSLSRDATARIGAWMSSSRSMVFAPSLLWERSWGAVLEVLKHEMAHQYVDEVLRVQGESAHGPTFRRVCEERGIDARATELRGERKADVPSRNEGTDRIVGRIRRLLALAESPNEHEAQNAMAIAHDLMLKHQIALETQQTSEGYHYRYVGTQTARIYEAHRILSAILSEFFFVRCIWVPGWQMTKGKPGQMLELCGAEEKLEVAVYAHDFLMHTGEQLFRAYRKKRDASKGYGVSSKQGGLPLRKSKAPRGGRLAFLAGVMAGFYKKLSAEKSAQASAHLVLAEDAALAAYYRKRHPRVRSVSASGQRERPDAFRQGSKAGQDLGITPGIKAGGRRAPRLLGSG